MTILLVVARWVILNFQTHFIHVFSEQECHAKFVNVHGLVGALNPGDYLSYSSAHKTCLACDAILPEIRSRRDLENLKKLADVIFHGNPEPFHIGFLDSELQEE